MTGGEERRDDDIALAGEYVLRLLPPEEEAEAAARAAADPAFRALVVRWQEGLAAMALEEGAEVPPAALWARIEREAFGTPVPRPRLLLSPWRWLAGAAAALAVLLVLYAALPFGPGATTHRAEIAAEDRSLVIEAALESDGTLRIARQTGTAPPGRVLELWLITEGAVSPVSLGVLPEAAEARLAVPEPLRAAFTGGTLAITDEPPGGAPGGVATGTVLAIGPVRAL